MTCAKGRVGWKAGVFRVTGKLEDAEGEAPTVVDGAVAVSR